MAIGERERAWVLGGVQQNVRSDGRQRGDFRRVEVETGVIAQASGSARVRIGGTEVLVGIHGEIGAPNHETPDRGALEISVEVSALAGPRFSGRTAEDAGAELTKSMERAMTAGKSGGGALDLRTLCLVPGKVAWTVHVDAVVLTYDGALVDAVSVAIRAALLSTRLPHVEVVGGADGDDEPQIEVDDEPEHSVPLAAGDVPVVVTVAQLGRCYVVDCTPEEEACSSGAMELILKEMIPRADALKNGDTAGIKTALLILDVRPADSFEEGSIPASHSFPVGEASKDKLLELVRQAQSKWGAEIPVDLVLVGSGGVMDAEQMFARMTRVWGVDEAHVRVLEGGFEAWRDLRDNFNR